MRFDGERMETSCSMGIALMPDDGIDADRPLWPGGFGLNVFAEPRGRYNFVLEGCPSGTNLWQGARYTAEIPAGTSVTVWARSADTRDGLTAEEWIGPFEGNPADFTMAPGPVPSRQFLQVELRLSTTDRMAAPRVFDIEVAGICEPIVE